MYAPPSFSDLVAARTLKMDPPRNEPLVHVKVTMRVKGHVLPTHTGARSFDKGDSEFHAYEGDIPRLESELHSPPKDMLANAERKHAAAFDAWMNPPAGSGRSKLTREQAEKSFAGSIDGFLRAEGYVPQPIGKLVITKSETKKAA